ncbi:NADase-type glycan-binding domain-containing protein [Streptomyces flavovirens]
MRSCPACGSANGESDDFCGNCGSYLGWSQERPEPAPAPEPAPEPAPAPPPMPAGPTRTPPPDAAPPGPAPAPPAEAAPVARPATAEAAPSTAPAPRPPDAAPRTGTPGPAPRPPAPRTPAASPSHAADPDPVLPVRPAKPVAQRPVVRPVAAQETPDGPPCPACGTPNAPDRQFCRRCAARLRPSAPEAPLPWWRTVWPFRRTVRNGSDGRWLRRGILLLFVAALLVTGFLLLPAGRYVFEDVRDKLGGTTAVSPSKVTASAQAPGHPATAATDGITNEYWGAPALDASLTCDFEDPFRLVGIVVHTGSSVEPEEFRRTARPVRAELRVTTADGDTDTRTVTFDDKPGEQDVRMGISDVVSVQLILRDAAGPVGEQPVALGEIEFFRRS